MTVEERLEFWDILLKMKNDDDLEKLNEKIIFPDKFYRYRSVSIRNLNAISENKLYFSASNYYDDPFDTFIYVDYKKLQESTGKSIEELKEARDIMRRNFWSICFTEKCSNEYLWLKYADSHKGIVLEYEPETLKRKTEDSIFSHIFMYPMAYSDVPYDATNFTKFVLDMSSVEIEKFDSKCDEILDSGLYMWDMERILLNKKMIHHYDEEWRLILGNSYVLEYNKQPTIKIKPTKIILGLKISDDDKKAVLMAAEKATIKSIEQMTIDDNDNFVAKPIKF